jgi:dedicator of cytokinesis protein 3
VPSLDSPLVVETVPRDGQLDKARTLFRDLSQQDILDTLVLVCRIVINGHVKAGTSTSTNYRASSTNLNSPYLNGAPPSSASFASPALQSSSSLTDPYQRLDNNSLEGMVDTSDDMRRTCRRPFGCAVVDISQLCKVGQSAVTTTELTMPIFVPMNEANFSTLHEDILASRIKEFQKSPKAEHISIGLRCLHEDVQNLARDHPSLMAGTSLTSRLGFPEVVLPGHHRSDLYIKLWSGDFPSLISTGKLKGLAVNVEVEAEVRTGEGTVVPMAISRGSGQPSVTRYTSIVMSNNLSPSKLLYMRIVPVLCSYLLPVQPGVTF